jgi:tripartite-type tricarboxylate transporter receptor subunit TctC
LKKAVQIIATTAVVLFLAFMPAAAQDYPARTTTIICPYAPGGATDILSRMLGRGLEERLGKSFVTENRPGAGTVLAAHIVAKAQPDGYTLLMGTSTPLAINATLHRNLPYDPAKDFVPLALIANVPFVLVVTPSLPVKSVADLVKYAKDNPGKLSFGTSGPGSPHHLYMELFKTMTSTEMVHVPYKGSVPALTDVIAGRIPVMFVDLAPALQFIKNGNVRAIGVSSITRVPQLPEVPPVADSVPGFEAVAWQMLVAPNGTPKPIVDRLHAELKSIEAIPEFKEQVAKLGTVPVDTPSVAELQAYVKSEIVRWGKIVEKSGAAMD